VAAAMQRFAAATVADDNAGGLFNCQVLQCFDAVAWAAGTASGL